MSFRPQGIFYLGGGDVFDYSEPLALVPAALRKEVQAALGCPLAGEDVDLRLYGRPFCWQGEDEVFPDEEGDEGEGGEEGPSLAREAPRHLLLQDEFGEGHVHFWIDAADAERRDYAKSWLDYSGT